MESNCQGKPESWWLTESWRHKIIHANPRKLPLWTVDCLPAVLSAGP